MPEPRRVGLFRHGRYKAVRIPAAFELPGDEAIMHRDGDRLVIEPVRKRGLVALLRSMKPPEETFPEIDDPLPARESIGASARCRSARTTLTRRWRGS